MLLGNRSVEYDYGVLDALFGCAYCLLVRDTGHGYVIALPKAEQYYYHGCRRVYAKQDDTHHAASVEHMSTSNISISAVSIGNLKGVGSSIISQFGYGYHADPCCRS